MTGTSGWYVVQWADSSGTGFSPDEPHGQDVPRDFWSVAGRMLRDEVVQPPESIRSTLPHPVWGLRHVRVGELGGFWCFTEQGRGGPFGIAGTCRFSFAAEDGWLPGKVWREGRERAIGEPPAGRSIGRDRLEQVLAGLLSESGPVGVPGPPADVADVIEAFLNVLPPAVVRSRIWHTCLLQRPSQRSGLAVAGRWPEEFRHNPTSLARQLDQLLDPGLPAPAGGPPFADDRAAETFAWLVDQATVREQLPEARNSPATTVADFLLELRPLVTRLTWRDVPDQLRSAQGRARLGKAPRVLEEWAVKEPAAARRLLLAHDDPDLCDRVFLRMLDVQWDNAHDVLDLPVSDVRLSDWHRRLAKLLSRHLPDVEDRAARIRALTQPGMPFADPVRLRNLSGWLRTLELSPWRHPRLFPDRAFWVADEIIRTGAVGTQVIKELDCAPDPIKLLVEAVNRMAAPVTWARATARTAARVVGEAGPAAPITARTAAAIIAAGYRCAPPRDAWRVTEVARVLADRCAGGNRLAAERWLGELLDWLAAWGTSATKRLDIMNAGLSALPRRKLRSVEPRDSLLRRQYDVLRQYDGGSPGADPRRSVADPGAGVAGGGDGDLRRWWLPTQLSRWKLAGILVVGTIAVPTTLLLFVNSEGPRTQAPAARVPFSSVTIKPSLPDGGDPLLDWRDPRTDQGGELPLFSVDYESAQAHLGSAMSTIFAELETGLRGRQVRQVVLTGCTASAKIGKRRAAELRDALLAWEHPDLAGADIVPKGSTEGCQRGTIEVEIKLR